MSLKVEHLECSLEAFKVVLAGSRLELESYPDSFSASIPESAVETVCILGCHNYKITLTKQKTNFGT